MQFKTKGGSALKEYCGALTKEDCRHQRNYFIACEKVRIYESISFLKNPIVCYRQFFFAGPMYFYIPSAIPQRFT